MRFSSTLALAALSASGLASASPLLIDPITLDLSKEDFPFPPEVMNKTVILEGDPETDASIMRRADFDCHQTNIDWIDWPYVPSNAAEQIEAFCKKNATTGFYHNAEVRHSRLLIRHMDLYSHWYYHFAVQRNGRPEELRYEDCVKPLKFIVDKCWAGGFNFVVPGWIFLSESVIEYQYPWREESMYENYMPYQSNEWSVAHFD